MPHQDIIQGMLIGLALGDALGAPHEFKYQRNIPYTGILQYPPKMASRFQGARHGVIGQFTDDSEMALTLARSLIRNKGYNRNDIILSYEAWANSKPMGMGRNTRNLFCGVTTINGYEKRYHEGLLETNKNRIEKSIPSLSNNQGNGSLMRSAPLALTSGYDDVLTDCKLTNPSLVNQECSTIYITILRYAFYRYDPVSIFQAIRNLGQTKEVKEVIEQVAAGTNRDVTYNKGWVVHTLYCAIAAFTNLNTVFHGSYSEAINWVIMKGGDTDTNACVTGALIGAFKGYTGLLSELDTYNNIVTMLNANSNLGDFPRHPEYTLHDINGLSTNLSILYPN